MINEQSSADAHSKRLALLATRSPTAPSVPRAEPKPCDPARQLSTLRSLWPDSAPAARQQIPSWSLRAAGLSRCAWSASQALPLPRRGPPRLRCPAHSSRARADPSPRVCPQPAPRQWGPRGRCRNPGPHMALSPDGTPGDVYGRGGQADTRVERSNAYPGLSGSKAFSVPSHPWGFVAFNTAVPGEWGFSQRTQAEQRPTGWDNQEQVLRTMGRAEWGGAGESQAGTARALCIRIGRSQEATRRTLK